MVCIRMDLGDLLIFLSIFITIFVVLQLRSVLGKRTGNEKPFSGFSFVQKKFSASSSKDDKWKIVSLDKEKKQDNIDCIDELFPCGTKLNESLRGIVSVCPSFNVKYFLTEAREAYELIVTAFFNGDISKIEKLVDNKVYLDFGEVIAKRKLEDKTLKSSLVGIDEVNIVGANIEDGNMYITTRIVGQFISCSYDKDNVLISSDPEVFGKVVDTWTFVKGISSDNQDWKLISTE
ncbi:MAG: hypothetical protein C4617_00885 [Candidatus Liberibacter europaeus]|uniref:Tim44-like domain-containing protein n=1 Tax=Candidatus Liberibacter europaeus TaxID=744859 RepID=A0A2T4VYX7_9HYPH|nr:hypothetical protein [Candidatus Liberibacter europaeus]PTL86992.1 MAG: hypothetical protein C4617_00885 [Candidatus Liberibacter europaeus]